LRSDADDYSAGDLAVLELPESRPDLHVVVHTLRMLVRLPDGAAGDEKTQQKLLKLVEDGARRAPDELGTGWVREVLAARHGPSRRSTALYQPIRQGAGPDVSADPLKENQAGCTSSSASARRSARSPASTTARLPLGETLLKAGRATGVTEGRGVHGEHGRLSVPLLQPPTPERWAHFKNLLVVRSRSRGTFAASGDSGGPVFRRTRDGLQLVGTVLGGLTLADGDSIALVLTITPELLAELRRLGYEPFLS